jgi:glycosyltransferase involved in cell wall biosynthesis
MVDMVKVLHVIGGSGPGGAERMFADTISGLNRRGRTENIGFFCSIIEFPALLNAIHREMPDIIYAYHPSLCILTAAIAGKILGRKVIVRRFAKNDALPPLSRLADVMSYFLCDRIVALSRDSVEELVGMGIARGKICCIYNGKDPAAYRSGMGRTEAKRALGVSGFVFGMVGRIVRLKGQEMAIKALAKVAQGNNATLVIAGKIGDDRYKDRLVRLIGETGLYSRVIFTGHRSDINDVLAAFDAFVHVSESEGCPSAVLEAMCVRLPVIAAEEGATREVLGDCAVFVPSGDEEMLADAMKKVIRSGELRKLLGRKASRRVRNEFSLEAMAAKYEDLFRKLAPTRP